MLKQLGRVISPFIPVPVPIPITSFSPSPSPIPYTEPDPHLTAAPPCKMTRSLPTITTTTATVAAAAPTAAATAVATVAAAPTAATAVAATAVATVAAAPTAAIIFKTVNRCDSPRHVTTVNEECSAKDDTKALPSQLFPPLCLDVVERQKCISSPLWASGFSFSDSSLLVEAPYDPRLSYLFFGEEISLAAR